MDRLWAVSARVSPFGENLTHLSDSGERPILVDRVVPQKHTLSPWAPIGATVAVLAWREDRLLSMVEGMLRCGPGATFMEKLETLAEIIRRLRCERAWSQEHLAAVAGVSLRTVQRVETGFPCASETVQALAAALAVEAATLVRAAPATAGADRRRLGLVPWQAAVFGLALCLPSSVFIAANIGFYTLHLDGLASLTPDRPAGALLSLPILVVGGPLLAIALNLPHLFGVRARTIEDGTWFEGVLVRWNPWRIAVVVLALVLLGVLAAYLISENLLELIVRARTNALPNPS